MFASGELRKLIASGLRGMTSNPSIFEKAIDGGSAYDAQIESLIGKVSDPGAIFEALAAERSDAWRCFVGNEIHDPCFSSPAAHGIVLCPNEQLSTDTEIHLTRSLPTAQADHGIASIHDRPWLIEVGPKCAQSPSPANCFRCEFEPGAQPSVNGKRLNYECSGAIAGFGAFGLPNRNVEPWTITVGKDIGKGSVAFTLPVVIVHAWM